MPHALSFDSFLRHKRAALAQGPVALIFAEDSVGLAETLHHHLDLGFHAVVLCALPGIVPPPGFSAAPVHLVEVPDTRPPAVAAMVSRIQARAPRGTWIYWSYSAEFLFFPFCEHRSVRELLTFHAQERRRAMIAFTIDLYGPQTSADNLPTSDGLIDRTGYYALARTGPEGPLERQLDVFGGLRWRFEEHIPHPLRRIDRVALFQSDPSLRMAPDATLSEAELNTYQCAWHHNLTCAVVSFRTAKALLQNPGSRHAIDTLCWTNSVPFQWSSQQLMDLGLMEPGQWF